MTTTEPQIYIFSQSFPLLPPLHLIPRSPFQTPFQIYFTTLCLDSRDHHLEVGVSLTFLMAALARGSCLRTHLSPEGCASALDLIALAFTVEMCTFLWCPPTLLPPCLYLSCHPLLPEVPDEVACLLLCLSQLHTFPSFLSTGLKSEPSWGLSAMMETGRIRAL